MLNIVVSSHTFSPQVSLSCICEQKEHPQPQVFCPSTILPTLLEYLYSKFLIIFQKIENFSCFVYFRPRGLCNFTNLAFSKQKQNPQSAFYNTTDTSRGFYSIIFMFFHLYISDSFLLSLTLNFEM